MKKLSFIILCTAGLSVSAFAETNQESSRAQKIYEALDTRVYLDEDFRGSDLDVYSGEVLIQKIHYKKVGAFVCHEMLRTDGSADYLCGMNVTTETVDAEKLYNALNVEEISMFFDAVVDKTPDTWKVIGGLRCMKINSDDGETNYDCQILI